MTDFYKIVENGYINGIGTNGIGTNSPDTVTEISETEYNEILSIIRSAPVAPDGYCYRLTEELEWVLEHLPPETFTEDEALVCYSNELTGASDETLEEATETLIKLKMEE